MNGSENFGRSDDEKALAIDGTDLNGDIKVSENASGGVLKESTAGTGQQDRCRPCGEYHCVYTDLPKFLVTYSPKVHMSYQRLPLHCRTIKIVILNFTMLRCTLYTLFYLLVDVHRS